ncbi:MAG: hypothetical protein K1X71_12110 [Pirellulales bacterium]|nr:hypothetical protein [Pirellulales bacterium]
MKNQRHNTRSHRQAYDRRGAVTLVLLAVIVIGIALAAWSINWAYLVLMQQNMQKRTDLIALAAAPALLDEDLLRDAQGEPQSRPADDVVAARRLAQHYRHRANSAGGAALELHASDVKLTAGRVPDPKAPRPRFGLRPATGATHAFNTVRVEAQRSRSGDNPVLHLLAGFMRPHATTVGSNSLATLDNHVVGFRPTHRLSAPVAPLAISSRAWKHDRSQDSDSNSVKELVVRLAAQQSSPLPSNSAIVATGSQLNLAAAIKQVSHGVVPSELLPRTQILGPATPTAPLNLLATEKATAATAAELAGRFNQVARSQRNIRAFPIYSELDEKSHEARIIGFVAARVLEAKVEGRQLTLRIEPAYLIHPTVHTTSPQSPLRPEQNLYLHKLALTS